MKIEQILSGIFQITGDAPELNMSNYSEDEVERLNDAMIEIHNLAKQAYDTRTEDEGRAGTHRRRAGPCPRDPRSSRARAGS